MERLRRDVSVAVEAAAVRPLRAKKLKLLKIVRPLFPTGREDSFGIQCPLFWRRAQIKEYLQRANVTDRESAPIDLSKKMSRRSTVHQSCGEHTSERPCRPTDLISPRYPTLSTVDKYRFSSIP